MDNDTQKFHFLTLEEMRACSEKILPKEAKALKRIFAANMAAFIY